MNPARPIPTRSGVVLVDVLVAIVVLTLIGAGFMRLHSEASRWFQDRRSREAEMVVFERLLVAHTMLDRRDLDLRFGARAVGDYMVTIQRPQPGVYRIGVGRRQTPERVEIETLVFLEAEEEGPR